MRLIGRLDAASAFSHVNRTLFSILEASSSWTALHDDGAARSVARPGADLTLWHDWETDFPSLEKPPEGKLAAIRPWDFGPYPPSWAEKVDRDCDELWVHSTWIRELALRSGILDSKIRVVPLGIDCSRFTPSGLGPDLPLGREGFRFLFAGATVRRKGFDVAVGAFLQAFEPGEDVCLVVKDREDGVFYEGQQGRDRSERWQPYLDAGNLVLVHENLPVDQLAALYRACDLLVLPYRAEGFALTAAEAMACGTPCMVPRFGACLDYCTEDNALFAPHRRICLPVDREIEYNALGFVARVDEVDFCEVEVGALARAMRDVFAAGRGALRDRGENAGETIAESFSLDVMAASVEEALSELLASSGCAAEASS